MCIGSKITSLLRYNIILYIVYYCHGKRTNLIVKLHSFCKVCVGFSLECSTSDGLGPNFTTKDPTHDIIIFQRSVKPGEQRVQTAH